jgi:hypothetical protein
VTLRVRDFTTQSSLNLFVFDYTAISLFVHFGGRELVLIRGLQAELTQHWNGRKLSE